MRAADARPAISSQYLRMSSRRLSIVSSSAAERDLIFSLARSNIGQRFPIYSSALPAPDCHMVNAIGLCQVPFRGVADLASTAGNSARSGLAIVGVTAAAAVLLLIPALLNHFPLIFPDTGAYMSVAWARTWTLDRSGF